MAGKKSAMKNCVPRNQKPARQVQNAAFVEQSATATESLKMQADQLAVSMAVFDTSQAGAPSALAPCQMDRTPLAAR